MDLSFKYCLPPVAAPDARLFILGSLPGDASLAAQRYYAHPTNQFWKLVGGAIGEPLDQLDYSSRLERLRERGIGLWDVVGSARRGGSLDGAIRAASTNPLGRLVDDYPQLRAVAFNGRTAASIGRRLLGEPGVIELIDLPSSSAALTVPIAVKAEKWSQLARHARLRAAGGDCQT